MFHWLNGFKFYDREEHCHQEELMLVHVKAVQSTPALEMCIFIVKNLNLV